MSGYQYNIAVIGAGPGGYETAIKAAQLGLKTCVIESGSPGGVCLNIGCIPTKTFIHSANLLSDVKNAAEFGVDGVQKDSVNINMNALLKRKNMIVKTLTGGVSALLKGNGVDYCRGSARFINDHELKAGENIISAEYIIIAVGSVPIVPSSIEIGENTRINTSTDALNLNYVPKTVAVIGGGVIGIEFAYIFNKFGSDVTVIEAADRILPVVDTEISEMLQKSMKKDGVKFNIGAVVKKITEDAVYYTANGEEKEAKADFILTAIGRAPNTEGLDAQAAGVEFNGAAINVNEYMQTNVPNIFAIGDVNGKCMLAHAASHEGLTAVENICGETRKMNYNIIPSCIYTSPEIASIGLTEEAAKQQNLNIKIGRFPMAANGRSLVEGDTRGLVKTIVEADTGRILGVHIYSAFATEMIGEIAAAMTGELTAEQILETTHPHPTVNESIWEAFESAWTGKPINYL